jgi:hypothetical protein
MELWGAAMYALAYPWAVAVLTWGVYMSLTGKDTNGSTVRDSAQERREWRWFLWPLAVSFFVTVVIIGAVFLNGDGYWFASRGTSEIPRSGTGEIPRTIRKDAGFVWTLQSRAPLSLAVSDNRLSGTVGLSMAVVRKSAGAPWLIYTAPSYRTCWVWHSRSLAGALSGVSFKDGHTYETFYDFSTDQRDVCGGLEQP